MLNLYKSNSVALLEPHIHGEIADDVWKSLKKKNWIRIEAMGFSGGIWILWDNEDVILKVRHINKQFVYLAALLTTDVLSELMAICVSPNPMNSK